MWGLPYPEFAICIASKIFLKPMIYDITSYISGFLPFLHLFLHPLLLRPPESQNFLAKIAHFSYLTPALCQKITFTLAKSPLLTYNLVFALK